MSFKSLTNNPSENNIPSYPFGYSTEIAFKAADLSGKDAVELADYITNGHLYSSSFFTDDPVYDINDINWDIQYSQSPSSYNLGLQTLNMVGFLCYGYQANQKTEYMERAFQLIKSWIAYAETNPENKYCWYDHSVSSRALNMIYFLTFMTDPNLAELYEKPKVALIMDTLKKHAEYLLDDNNYAPNSNHGIMSDRALAAIAQFLKSENQSVLWWEKAKQRLNAQFNSQFLADGSHVENSPGYAIGVLKWFIEIENFLNHFGESIGSEFRKIIQKSIEFMAYLPMPNGHFPMFGDTEDVKFRAKNYYQQLVNQIEIMPIKFAVFPLGGYAFLKETDEGENEQSTWIGFKAGYVGGTAHKHCDDTSFVLYSRGQDIFIDPGRYNYERTNKIRQYFVSSVAHNTIMVDQKPFTCPIFNANRTGFLDWDSKTQYDYILGTNGLYPGVSIDRHLYYIRPDTVIIFDDILAEEEHSYSQLFHLNENIKVRPVTNKEVILELADQTSIVRIRQFNRIEDFRIHRGDLENERLGKISRHWNQIIPTNTLEFTTVGKNSSFITILTIENRETGYEATSRIRYIPDTNIIDIEDANTKRISIRLNSRSREIPSRRTYGTVYSQTGVPIKVIIDPISDQKRVYTVTPESKDKYQYAWYIYKDGNVIEKKWYKDENKLEREFSGSGLHEVQLFVLNKTTGEKTTMIIDAFCLDD